MEETKQAVEVTVRETEKQEPIVKEARYTINTLGVQTASIETDEIIGELKHIIVVSPKQASIKVSLSRYPDIKLLDFVQFQGIDYVIPKRNSVNEKGEVFNFNSELYTLKDKLTLEVSGGQNTQVEFILRYC